VVTLAGQVIFLVNLFWSLRRGPVAEANPWECTTLEWTERTLGRNDGTVVNHGPYEYGSFGVAKDFLAQDAPAG